jgi:hypothetical protein
MALQRADEVILGASEEMRDLLASLPGAPTIYCKWQEIPPHAVYALSSGLCHLFRTTPDSIPARDRYLSAPPDRVAQWRDWLAGKDPGRQLRVGLTWTGRPTHPNDQRRSLRLEALSALATIPGIHFVSLQKPIPDADLTEMRNFSGMENISAALRNFADTAAVIENLDLVVTIDSSIAHLAGALSVPCWILLPNPNDWRWLMNRDDSIWYNSVRLFRQPRPGDWGSVTRSITEALAALRQSGVRRSA